MIYLVNTKLVSAYS